MSQDGMGRLTAALLDVPGSEVEQEMAQLRQCSGHCQFVSDLGHGTVGGIEPREPGTGERLIPARVQTGDRASPVFVLVDVDLNGPCLHGVHGDPIGRMCPSILRGCMFA
jgi:hypothetical protein